MRFAAVGFTCIDVYKNLNISYPTGNGIDLMFNLMDLVPELVPSVVTAIGDDAYGQSMLEGRYRTCYHCSRGTDGSDRDAVKWQRPGASQGGKRSHDSISANGRGYGFYPDTGLHSYRSFVECDRIAEGHEKQGNEDLF